MKALTIVLPVFNEEEVLPDSIAKLKKLYQDMRDTELISDQSRLLFVNDGSKDRSWPILEKEMAQTPYITGVKLSRNFGHQNALLAGMTTAVNYSDIIITIDVDLQDDINVIPKMVQASENYDVIYGVRSNRETDTAFKRDTAGLFYKFMGKIGVQMIPNSADFRLLSQRATEALLSFKERNLFLRGLTPLIGFPSTKVYYARKPREAGETKYPLKKMIGLAMDGITSFSVVPIKIVMNIGLLFVLFGLGVFIWALVQRAHGNVIRGWTSVFVSIWIVGGMQLISLSVIGEYIGKIFKEVKRRPRFIIEEDTYSQTFEQK